MIIEPKPRGWSDELEAGYRRRQQDVLARASRVVALVGALAIVAFGLADLARGEVIWGLLALRFGVMVPALVAAVALSYSRRLRGRFEAVVAIVFALVASAEAAYLLVDVPAKATIYQTGFVLILLGGYAGTRVRFRLVAPAGLAASALAFAFLLVVEIPSSERTALVLYLLTANFLGLLVARHQEMLARLHHADGAALHRQQEELRELNGALQEMALRDTLTGLLNRRALDDRLGEALAVAARRGEAGVVALLDLDGFKAINDGMGHAAGDEVLRQVAGVMVEELRGSDRAFRLGGDEFCLLLPDAGVEEARVAVERLLISLRQRLAALGAPVGFSAGCTAIDPGDLSIDDVLGRADRLLYEAKEAGKGRVLTDRAVGIQSARALVSLPLLAF